ncbi:hypothetical protein KI688_002172 [Linnemannia hyalina]|uniref:HCP-like protein n=1 Tax=Linnemannia hyalina TaxID=64524 RepID=A0A9P8BRV8_9FUNG|nr:hypothetical protein KI688_002172 [Linnemannia hyalina]
MITQPENQSQERVQAIRSVYRTITPNATASTIAATESEFVHVTVYLDPTGREIVFWEDICSSSRTQLEPLCFIAIPDVVLDVYVEAPLMQMDPITSVLRALQVSPAAGPHLSLHSANLPTAHSTFELAPRPAPQLTRQLSLTSEVHPKAQPAPKSAGTDKDIGTFISAKAGDVHAPIKLAEAYSSKAAVWYNKVAHNGSAKVQSNLGILYIKDDGVEKNNTLAMLWLVMAVKQGNASTHNPFTHPLAEVMLITQNGPQERVQAIRPIYKISPSASTSAVSTTPPSNLEIVQIEVRLDSDGKDIILWDDILSAFKDAVNIRRGVKVLPFLKDKEFKNLHPLRIAAVPNTVLDVLVDDLSVSATTAPVALTPPPSLPRPTPSSVPEPSAQPVPQLAPRPVPQPVSQAASRTSNLLESALPHHPQPKTTRRLASRPKSQSAPHPALHSVLLSPSQSPLPSVVTMPSRIHNLDPKYAGEDAKGHSKNYTSTDDSSSDESNNNTPSAIVKSPHSTQSTENHRISYLDNTHGAVEDITYTFIKAQQGDLRSQFKLAMAYKHGSDGLFQSDESAMSWLRKAAEQGHAGAECEIGLFYEMGRGGVEEDDVAAVEWYRKAANRGHADAQKNLGSMYAQGWGVEEDHSEAARWYCKAAGQGHASAQFSLAVLYTQGQGVPKDGFKAYEWFRKAASQGHVEARFSLGSMYFDSQCGVHKNYSKAMNQFQKAAAEGHCDAQFHIGVMHANGLGVPQDDEKAMPWFYMAAKQCHAEAQSCLAVLFFTSRGVVQDHEEALQWFLKAARQGHIPSMFNLGIIYSSKRFWDKSLAMYWYLKAADGGYKGAREAYETLSAQH